MNRLKHDHPEHWIRGQLLDMRRFTDGSFRCCLLHEEFGHKDTIHKEFQTADDAQNFVSWWYNWGAVGT